MTKNENSKKKNFNSNKNKKRLKYKKKIKGINKQSKKNKTKDKSKKNTKVMTKKTKKKLKGGGPCTRNIFKLDTVDIYPGESLSLTSKKEDKTNELFDKMRFPWYDAMKSQNDIDTTNKADNYGKVGAPMNQIQLIPNIDCVIL